MVFVIACKVPEFWFFCLYTKNVNTENGNSVIETDILATIVMIKKHINSLIERLSARPLYTCCLRCGLYIISYCTCL